MARAEASIARLQEENQKLREQYDWLERQWNEEVLTVNALALQNRKLIEEIVAAMNRFGMDGAAFRERVRLAALKAELRRHRRRK